ncbi:MAG: hypothetical protein DME80_14135 [Verrucomicrobia bacterium]|nr:MAG: hypothetical protein DME80_14135 [Verrucomicrobiota bacterium]
MKMNLDDPKLTAYALGELEEPEKSAVARAISDSPEAQRVVIETQQVARALRSQYKLELNEEWIVPRKFIAVTDDPFWSKAGPLAIAAVLTLLALIGALVLATNRSGSALHLAGSSPREQAESGRFSAVEGEETAQFAPDPSRDFGAAPYAYVGEHPFVSVSSNPRSSFPIIVTLGSYSEVLQSINAGILPPRDTVRIEQMINYFNYDYPGPSADEPFSVNVDVVSCPWEQSHRLVRIGLKGRKASSDVHGANIIARDTKIDIEFNPVRVGSYRLIGYDRRSLQGENSNREGARDHGIAAGYTVTALYELVPVAQQFITRQEAQTLLSAKLRFKKPDGNGEVQSIERSVTDDWVDFAQAHPDLKFAAAVAEFGMILCDSGYKGSGTLGAVLKWAQEGKGADANGYRAGFIELVRKAQTLKKS